MSTIKIIAIFIIVVGSIFIAVFISLFKLVAGMFYAPVPYYPIPRKTKEANNTKGGDNQTRVLFTLILLILLLLWMVAHHRAEGMFESESPEWNNPNTAIMSAMISMPDLMAEEGETKPDAVIEKKESTDLYYVQFAAITDQRLAKEAQQRLRTSLHREVVIVNNGIWHFLLAGPFDQADDARDYAQSTGLENMIKSESEL